MQAKWLTIRHSLTHSKQRPKEEPETIRQWRVEQAKRLEEKDAKEAETMAKLRDEAKQELADW